MGELNRVLLDPTGSIVSIPPTNVAVAGGSEHSRQLARVRCENIRPSAG